MRKLLIVGIDPGTTSAYAVFDTDGNLLKIKSRRNFSMDSLIKEVVDFGKVLVVSVDVFPAPGFAEKIAKKLNAKLITPDTSLFVSKKTKLVDDFLKRQKEFIKISNKHEKDALASALYGYKKVREFLGRIEENLKKIKDPEKAQLLKEKIFREKVSITKTLREFG